MRNIVGRIMYGVGLLLGAFLLIISIFAYLISGPNHDGTIVDGLGRPLSLSPLFVRLIFGQERLWAGFRWFMADMIIFWGGVGLIYLLITNGIKLLEKNSNS